MRAALTSAHGRQAVVPELSFVHEERLTYRLSISHGSADARDTEQDLRQTPGH